MIYELAGDDLGVFTNDAHRVVEWRGGGRVVFSYSYVGDAMSCHFASGKEGLRYVKPAINEFIQWLFLNYDCTMILANVGVDSVKRLLPKVGFKLLAKTDNRDLFVRLKDD